jgi:hypothetical protein
MNDARQVEACESNAEEAHWLGSLRRDPNMAVALAAELPLVTKRAGRVKYACRLDIQVVTGRESGKREYKGKLTALYDPQQPHTVIFNQAAARLYLQYISVPAIRVLVRGYSEQESNRLYLLDAKPWLRQRIGLIAAFGFDFVAPDALEAPPLELLRERFSPRPHNN